MLQSSKDLASPAAVYPATTWLTACAVVVERTDDLLFERLRLGSPPPRDPLAKLPNLIAIRCLTYSF